MKLLILSLFTTALIFIAPAYADAPIPVQAKKTIGDLVQFEKEFDYLRAEKLYLPSASIFLERIHPNNKPAEYVEIPARKSYQIAMQTKSQSLQRDNHDDFRSIKYEWLGNDIKVSATKHSKYKNSKTPHVFILKKNNEDNDWRIAQEYSIEYVVRQKDDPTKLNLFD